MTDPGSCGQPQHVTPADKIERQGRYARAADAMKRLLSSRYSPPSRGAGMAIHPNWALAVKVVVHDSVRLVWYSADNVPESGKWRPRFSVDACQKKARHVPISAPHLLDELFESERDARERAKQAGIDFAGRN
jgi:hypothetical protein